MTSSAFPETLHDTWTAAKGQADGAPLFIRFRSQLAGWVGHAALPNRLVVRWAYPWDQASAPDGGMPSPELLDAMTSCEDALVAGLEAGPHRRGVLTDVWTGGGLREWGWYVGDAAEAEAAVNAALAGAPRYPLDFHLEADPAWEIYTRLLANVGPAGAT